MKISELPQLGSLIDARDNGASCPDITDTHVIVSTTPHYMASQPSEISPGVDSGKTRDSLSSNGEEEYDGGNTLKASGPPQYSFF